MRQRLCWLTGLLLHTCLAQAGTYVIAAGVEQYDDPEISLLRFAVADARSVAAAFRASGALPRDVIVLTSDAQDPSKRPSRINLLRAFGQIKAQAKSDDKLVFFFAGHGVERNGEHFLLGVDTQRDLLEDTALPISLVNRALEGTACSEVLFLIDACRNDPTAGRGDSDAELSEAFARGLRPRFTGPVTKPKLLATLLACDAGQRAWESPENGHGAFSVFLVKALSGQAAGEDGQVTLSGLAEYVSAEVGSWAARSNRQQQPRLVNPDGGDMVILTAPPEPVVSVAFQNHTLAQVVDLLAEQFSAQVVLGPGADPALTVTGRLDNQPLGTVLKVLVAAHGLTARREDRIYWIEGQAAEGPVAPAVGPAPDGANQRPANWPDYLYSFTPPAGMTWESFRVSTKDGMPQVLIPAGEFEMGSSDGQGESDEHPQKWVFLSAYWMDLHEVTNEQYAKYEAATGQSNDPWARWSHDTSPLHPAVNVRWEDATAYAQWAGRRLPTEAQWEMAARAGTTTSYPWGNAPDPQLANGDWQATRARTHEHAVEYCQAVGSYPTNRYGLYDMVGNVWEWCQDWYDGGWYARMPGRDPENTTQSAERVVRGGSWHYIGPMDLLVANRGYYDPSIRLYTVGFRCAAPAP